MNVEIGSKVYFCDKYHNFFSGYVTGFLNGNEKHTDYCCVRTEDCGERTVCVYSCYPTQEECYAAWHKELDEEILEYKKKINTIEELVSFCITHTVCYCEEYTDLAARSAALEKAKEFGIEIDFEHK